MTIDWLLVVFNPADWLLLDELWIGVMRPRWLAPPGMDSAKIPFEHTRHFIGFVRGSSIFAVLATLIALGVRSA